MKQLLNIGGGSKNISIPDRYKDYEHLILDVSKEADYQYDLLDLMKHDKIADSWTFDAIYMSHMLEHFHPSQILPILKFIRKLLKPEGTLQLRVPDILAVMKHIIEHEMSFIDPLYVLSSGISITTLDTLFGYQHWADANEMMRHRMAFDKPTLNTVVHLAGFTKVEWLAPEHHFELDCLCQS